jgi:hypothetical protein
MYVFAGEPKKVREICFSGARNPIFPDFSGCRNERYNLAWKGGWLLLPMCVSTGYLPLSGNLDISSW